MLRRYATREEIATQLAPYKVNEVVTLLTDRSTEDGTYIKGTKFRVKRANFRLYVSVPKIYIDEIQNYYINGDINQAIYYELTPLTNDKEYLFCDNCDFEKGNITPEEFSLIYESKKRLTLKEKLGFVCFFILVVLTLIYCFFAFKSSCAVAQNTGDVFKSALFTALVGVSGGMMATIPHMILTHIRVCKKGRKM